MKTQPTAGERRGERGRLDEDERIEGETVLSSRRSRRPGEPALQVGHTQQRPKEGPFSLRESQHSQWHVYREDTPQDLHVTNLSTTGGSIIHKLESDRHLFGIEKGKPGDGPLEVSEFLISSGAVFML